MEQSFKAFQNRTFWKSWNRNKGFPYSFLQKTKPTEESAGQKTKIDMDMIRYVFIF